MAQRANISATWYTWLEQGRGGAPSADVLDRIAHALMLTDVEREHAFILGLGRSPEARYRPAEGVTPRLQRVLDAVDPSPALIRTVMWDVVAWNRAASLILTDYAKLEPHQRNVLRLMFLDPAVREAQTDWESVARYVVAVFRADAARVGASDEMQALAEELCRASPQFRDMWEDHDVRHSGEGIKRLIHPVLGELAMEYSSFAVDGRPDLAMVIYNPAGPDDAARIGSLIAEKAPECRKTGR